MRNEVELEVRGSTDVQRLPQFLLSRLKILRIPSHSAGAACDYNLHLMELLITTHQMERVGILRQQQPLTLSMACSTVRTGGQVARFGSLAQGRQARARRHTHTGHTHEAQHSGHRSADTTATAHACAALALRLRCACDWRPITNIPYLDLRAILNGGRMRLATRMRRA